MRTLGKKLRVVDLVRLIILRRTDSILRLPDRWSCSCAFAVPELGLPNEAKKFFSEEYSEYNPKVLGVKESFYFVQLLRLHAVPTAVPNLYPW